MIDRTIWMETISPEYTRFSIVINCNFMRRSKRKIRDRNTFFNAAFYILSGCLQPILMTVCKESGLGHETAQVYMFFYSLGPAVVILPLLLDPHKRRQWPTKSDVIFRAVGIAMFDVVATCMNYIGAACK